MKLFRALPLLFAVFFLHSENFIIGELVGQLGNQLFVVAATVSLALDRGATPVFPDFLTRNELGIPINHEKVFYRLNTHLPKHCIYRNYYEPHFHYASIPNLQSNLKIIGYFQSERYFQNHKTEILDLFAPSESISNYLSEKYQELIDHPNTVALHVRSYEREDPKGALYVQSGREYIQKAIECFSDDSLFVVFSNDLPWCKNLLQGIERNFRFIEGEEYYHDFYLMTLCKHNIISNSSLSWWGGYLNRNPDKVVIAPKNWFNPQSGIDDRDLIPSEWIRI